MIRRGSVGLVALALAVPQPASAQFGGLFGKKSSETKSGGCDTSKPKSRGASILGKIVDNITDRTVGRSAVAQYVPIPEVSGVLSDAIACRLDQHEQRQAAAATTQAVRSEKIGASAGWKSETRPDVSGTSTVTARTRTADGTSCLTVNDVIIVNGEETTVPKKMCRSPGASGYTLTA